jgi:hypothetical protein
LELAPEYERKKAAYLEASKNSNDTIARRRVINAEIKDFKQQKTEMEKYDQLCHDRVSDLYIQFGSSKQAF